MTEEQHKQHKRIKKHVDKDIKRGMCRNCTELARVIAQRLNASERQVWGVIQAHYGKPEVVNKLLEIHSYE